MQKVSSIAVILLGVANAVFFVLPIIPEVRFYDMWAPWALVQLVANIVIAVCLVREFLVSKTRVRWLYLSALLPLIAFVFDVVGTKLAIWKGGVISQYVFIVLLAIAAIMVLKYIPGNILIH